MNFRLFKLNRQNGLWRSRSKKTANRKSPLDSSRSRLKTVDDRQSAIVNSRNGRRKTDLRKPQVSREYNSNDEEDEYLEDEEYLDEDEYLDDQQYQDDDEYENEVRQGREDVQRNSQEEMRQGETSDRGKPHDNFLLAVADGTVFNDGASPLDFLREIGNCGIDYDTQEPADQVPVLQSATSATSDTLNAFSTHMNEGLDTFVADDEFIVGKDERAPAQVPETDVRRSHDRHKRVVEMIPYNSSREQGSEELRQDTHRQGRSTRKNVSPRAEETAASTRQRQHFGMKGSGKSKPRDPKYSRSTRNLDQASTPRYSEVSGTRRTSPDRAGKTRSFQKHTHSSFHQNHCFSKRSDPEVIRYSDLKRRQRYVRVVVASHLQDRITYTL